MRTSRDNPLFRNRTILIFILVLTGTIGLIARLAILQIEGYNDYQALARTNRVRIAPLPATRGLIFDRHGEILAENIPNYNLEVIPEQVSDINLALAELTPLLEISEFAIERFFELRDKSKPYASIPLVDDLSEKEVAKFAVNQHRFPGFHIKAGLIRHYPHGWLTAHVLGYVGRITSEEETNLRNADYLGTRSIGKSGIEKSYESILHGRSGYEEVETNAKGRQVRRLQSHATEPGYDIHISIDIDLQRTAHKALGAHDGAVAAMNPDNGELLALVSKPGFDPNAFVLGLSRQQYTALQTAEDRPLFDRALRGQYPPGSTIKPFLALAGIQHGIIYPGKTLYCPGYYKVPGARHLYRDWRRHGHGSVNMSSAIARSCDVFFYDLAHQLGIDRLGGFLRLFGFGKPTGVDLGGEKPGLVPSHQWKRKQFRQTWFPGETVITGIGQGFIQATPLQLATAVAAIANGGNRIRPRLATRIGESGDPISKTAIEPKISIGAGDLAEVTRAMIDVAHGNRGTARKVFQNLTYEVAAKSGTAQVVSSRKEGVYDERKIAKKLRDHALFIAFAPAQKPRIAVSVVVENGGQGSTIAAPVARQVIERHLSRRNPGSP